MRTASYGISAVLFTLSLAACGKEPAEVKGNLGGKELYPKAAIFDSSTIAGTSILAIAFSDNEAACDDTKANKTKVDSRVMAFVLTGKSAVKAGKYDVVSATSATPSDVIVVTGGYKQYSATCEAAATEVLTAGSVTLTKVDKDAVVGAFDVTFDNGDKTSGIFTADSCIGSLAASNSAVAPTCSK